MSQVDQASSARVDVPGARYIPAGRPETQNRCQKLPKTGTPHSLREPTGSHILMYIAIVSIRDDPTSNEANAEAVAEGIEHEREAEAASRFAPEDITSNALGAFFGQQLKTSTQHDGYGQNILQMTPVQFYWSLKDFLERLDPVDWGSLTQEQRACVVSWYAIDVDGTDHRRDRAGVDGDPCGICLEPPIFPFNVDPANPALITGYA